MAINTQSLNSQTLNAQKVNAQKVNAQTLNEQLLEAAKTDDVSAFEALLKQDANLKDAEAASGDSALAIAATNNRIVMVHHLLTNHKVSIDTKNKYNITALHQAAANNQFAMVNYLIIKHKEANPTVTTIPYVVLTAIAQLTSPAMAKHLLTHPEISIDEHDTGYKGDFVLTTAAVNGRADLLKLYLEHGAYIDLRLNLGLTVRELMETGFYKEHEKEILPLVIAAEQLLAIADKKEQKDNKDNKDNKDKQDNKESSESIEKIINTLGLGLNAARVKDKNTALHLAILRNNIPLVKLLLQHGAKTHLKNKTDANKPGVTAAELLANSKDPFIIAMVALSTLEYIVSQLEAIDDKIKYIAEIQETLMGKDARVTAIQEQTLSESKEMHINAQTKAAPLLEKIMSAFAEIESLLQNTPSVANRELLDTLKYKIGIIIGNSVSPLFVPLTAYQLLSSLNLTLNKNQMHNHEMQQTANGILFKIVMGRHFLLNPSTEQAEALSFRPNTASSLDTNTTSSLDTKDRVDLIESKQYREYRIKIACQHLMNSNLLEEKSMLRALITDYVFGENISETEHTFSHPAFKDFDGKDMTTLALLLMDLLKTSTLESKDWQQKYKSSEKENKKQQDRIAKLELQLQAQREQLISLGLQFDTSDDEDLDSDIDSAQTMLTQYPAHVSSKASATVILSKGRVSTFKQST